MEKGKECTGNELEIMTQRTKRHSANLNTDVFTKLSAYIAKWGNTKEAIVNQAVEDYVYGREEFLKLYAPHMTLENTTKQAFFIYDNDRQKTAVVRAKWNNTSEGNIPPIELNCELCENSDSCVHVKFALVQPDLLRIRKEVKTV